MRILVPLLNASSGNEPFYYLMARLRDLHPDMEFTVLAVEQALVDECAAFNLACHLLEESQPIGVPAWLHKRKETRFGKQLYDFVEEYRLRRRADRNARKILETLKPDALLLSGDSRSLLYSLCRLSNVNSVVIQITLDWLNIDTQLADIQLRQGRKGQTAKKILRLLSRVTRRRWMLHVRDEDFPLYGSDLGRTFGAALAGVRFDGLPLKGGMAARHVCVNGEAYRQSFVEAGMPPQKVILTGSPDHDRLYELMQCLSDADKSQIRAELDVSEKQPLITLFAQPFTERILPGIGNYADELVWIARQIAEIAPGAALVIKLHPNQRVEDFLMLREMPHVRVIGSQGGDAFNIRLTYASDVVMLRTSTAGYLALALDVPLMTYAFYGHPGENYFKDVNGSWHVSNRDEFSEGVRMLLSDASARNALIEKQRHARERHMLLDGQCCARIGEVLRNR